VLVGACEGPVGPMGEAGAPGMDADRAYVKKTIVGLDPRNWVFEDSVYHQTLHVPEITSSVVKGGFVQVQVLGWTPLPADRRALEGSSLFMTYTYEEQALTIWGFWGEGTTTFRRPFSSDFIVTIVSPRE